MKKRKLMLLLTLAVVSLTLSTVALAVYNHTYHFTGTSATEQVTLYFDVDCTELVPDPHNWGSISNEILTVYAKNTGDVKVHVTLVISTLVGCTVELSTAGFALDVAGTQQVDMTVTVTANPGEDLSWDLELSATKV